MKKKNFGFKYLCVFDMDGTLLGDDHLIPEANKEAIRVLGTRGIGVALATGRSELMTRNYVKALGITLPLISSNGALITDPVSGECLHKETFTDLQLRKILEHNIDKKNDYFLYTSDTVYYSKYSKRIEVMHLYNSHASLQDQIIISELPDNLEAAMAVLPQHGHRSVIKALISYQDETDLHFLKEFSEIESIQSQSISIDMMPKGCSKGKGLKFLAAYIGIDPENIFAFGDQHNDRPMLEFAGHAIVPSNAVNEVKEIADYIALSNNESGIADGIYNYVLKNIDSFV